MVEDGPALDQFVWAAGPASPGWMRGGSYLVARRIQISLGLWDVTALDGHQASIGREKLSGALLPVMPPTGHLLLASPARNSGQRLLRRGYSCVDGIEAAAPAPAAGLMFICFNSDPRRQFIPIQESIAGRDALSLYLNPHRQRGVRLPARGQAWWLRRAGTHRLARDAGAGRRRRGSREVAHNLLSGRGGVSRR